MGRDIVWEENIGGGEGQRKLKSGVGVRGKNQFYKKNTKVWWKFILFVFHVIEEGWVRRGGKGEGGCGEIFFQHCMSECHSLFPGSSKEKWQTDRKTKTDKNHF